MDWIKRNYDQLILALVALVLLGLSAYLIQNALAFQQIFAGIRGEVPQNKQIPPADLAGLDRANRSLGAPAAWSPKSAEGSLFVSVPYILDKNEQLVDPSESGAMLHPPVPNGWLFDHKLDILDNNILAEDPDGDGFTNQDEWEAHTDPRDKASHPEYISKLRLEQFIKQPFRLKFAAYDGDVKKPESLDFQINTLDVNQPTQFLKIGSDIAGTKFKIVKFDSKTVTNPSTGEQQDVSELTVQNKETKDNVVLILDKVVDSPDSYALFRYLWNNTQFKVQKDRVFALQPVTSVRYKVIDIQENQALIQTPKGGQVTVPHL